MLKDFLVDRRSLKGHVGLNAQAEIDRILHRMVDELLVPGISITVLQDGQTLFQRRYGFANLDFKTPVDPQKSVFRVASVSKPIAATALARMTNDKQIDLDASFYEYVPITPKNGGTLLFVNWRAIQLVSGDIEVLNTD